MGLFDEEDYELDDLLDAVKKYPAFVVNLNEENVKSIFNNSLATRESSSVLTSDLFSAGLGYSDMIGKKRHFFEFDQEIILKNKTTIQYLFGQLQAAHAQKTSLSTDDFLKNYLNQDWTFQKETLMQLLYLGNCSKINCIFPFNAHKNNTTSFVDSIQPTLSPKDPNFPAWWEEHKAEWEEKKKDNEEVVNNAKRLER